MDVKKLEEEQEEMDKFKEWGVDWKSAEYSSNWMCPNNCDNDSFLKMEEMMREKIVGCWRGNKVYPKFKPVVVIECPQCFTKFWFHVVPNTIKRLQKNSPNWPKENNS